MTLAPAARTLLDQIRAADMPPLCETPLEQARRADVALSAADRAEDVASIADHEIPGPDGSIPVRVYTPGAPAPRPLVVFFHGGGFVFCSIDTHDGPCRRLANAAGAVVVSVGYRLAPEDPFPAGLEDCYAATVWSHDHADELGADPQRLAVAGDSAGGNLAAATTLVARERGGPAIRFQALVYPVIDAACDSASYDENASGYFLEARDMHWFWNHYLGTAGDRSDPHASPIRADLAGLPPAVVVTAQYDPLRDEGEAYAAALRDAGVAVSHRRFDGMIHGFWSMPLLFPEADRVTEEIVAGLRDALEDARRSE